MTDTTPTKTSPRTRSTNPTRALTLSAAALLTVIAFQAGARLPQFGRGSTASAGQVSQVGGFTVMTSDANNEDIIVLLDGRNEEISVYRNENNTSVQLYQKVSLPRLFTDARIRETGK